ncbi:MAG: hydantoinase/oxoprolinase family protein [Euzebya sp.]
MTQLATATAGVDVGGTFTDAVVVVDGKPVMRKTPTTPEDQSVGVGAALAIAEHGVDVTAVAHGTTTATNAVLERDFTRPALLVTAGFADLLTIGRQNRPSLYDLRRVRPDPIISRDRVVTVDERIAADGSVLTALTEREITRVVARVKALRADAVAIVLLFSWARPEHERDLAAAITQAMPQVHITVSCDLVGSVREYERANTCALNAAVGPVMSRYLSRLTDRVRDAEVTVMTSGGGTAQIKRMVAEPVHTLLSGPAAGVVAAAAVARQAGFDQAVAFDMGGTSTDVCLIADGVPVIDQRGTIADLPIGTPTVGIHTVGAGGGSIALLDPGGALQVGPRSAGAVPGPACYGAGGTAPTVTDAHAVLGHLIELAAGVVQPDIDAARRAVDTLSGVTAGDIIDVIRAHMARALRRVTTEAGVDPTDLALVAYGGAGPLHASALARMLGCPVAILPPTPGVLSAVGLLTAPRRQEVSRTVMVPIDTDLRPTCLQLQDRVTGVWPERHWVADVRYVGQAHELRIPFADPASTTGLAADFEAAHTASYGYAMSGTPMQIVTVRLVVTGPALHEGDLAGWDLGPTSDPTTITADMGEGPQEIAVYARGSLTSAGTTIHGPALVTQPDSTGLLLADDVGTVDQHGNLIIRDRSRGAEHHTNTQREHDD